MWTASHLVSDWPYEIVSRLSLSALEVHWYRKGKLPSVPTPLKVLYSFGTDAYRFPAGNRTTQRL